MSQLGKTESGAELLARLGPRPTLHLQEASTVLGFEPSPGDVLELYGRDGVGKTELLLHLVTMALIPRCFHSACCPETTTTEIVWVDCDLKFSVLRLAVLLEQRLIHKLKNSEPCQKPSSSGGGESPCFHPQGAGGDCSSSRLNKCCHHQGGAYSSSSVETCDSHTTHNTSSSSVGSNELCQKASGDCHTFRSDQRFHSVDPILCSSNTKSATSAKVGSCFGVASDERKCDCVANKDVEARKMGGGKAQGNDSALGSKTHNSSSVSESLTTAQTTSRRQYSVSEGGGGLAPACCANLCGKSDCSTKPTVKRKAQDIMEERHCLASDQCCGSDVCSGDKSKEEFCVNIFSEHSSSRALTKKLQERQNQECSKLTRKGGGDFTARSDYVGGEHWPEADQECGKKTGDCDAKTVGGEHRPDQGCGEKTGDCAAKTAAEREVSGEEVERRVEECLRRVHVVRCVSSQQLICTLHSLVSLIAANRNIAVLVVDPISAFYWSDRCSDFPQSSSLLYKNMAHVTTVLKKITDAYGVLVAVSKQALIKPRSSGSGGVKKDGNSLPGIGGGGGNVGFTAPTATGSGGEMVGPPSQQHVEFLGRAWAELVSHRGVCSKGGQRAGSGRARYCCHTLTTAAGAGVGANGGQRQFFSINESGVHVL